MKKWTHEQKDAIAVRQCDLLVSASAGSGKTSVMIERIASMIEKGEAGVGEILVLTFTRESARNMKEKLTERLGSKFDLALASIGTFHKFCSDLVQTYFSVIGVNPSFAVLDESNAAVLQNEILNDIIERKYLEFASAIDAFCTSTSTKSLKDIVITVAKFLATRDNPKQWLEKDAFAGYQCNLCDNVAMQGIVNHYKQAGEYLVQQFVPSQDCHIWASRLAGIKDYKDLHAIALTFEKLKSMKKDVPEYTAKEILNKLLKKIKEQYVIPVEQMVKNQDADRELVACVVALVSEYMARYDAAKAEKNFLDFADLERYAVKIIADDGVVRRVREKYKYIFVDEYQDTNPVQEEILKLLAGKRNIFAVGDVKQSIYGFRGTEAAIFTDRMYKYQDSGLESKVIKLNKNFRSNSQILGFVNSVFEKIMRPTTAGIDYAKTSRFQIANDKLQTTNDIEVLVIDGGDSRLEAALIAEKIVELCEQGVSCGDIAVLARNSTNFDVLIGTFNDAGIKCITDKKQRADEIYEIALLNNALFAAFDHGYELPAVLTMQSFVFGFSAEDLAQIKLGKKEYPKSFKDFQIKYKELCKEKSVADVLTTFIAEYDIINKLLITPEGERRVRNIYNFLNKLRGASFAGTVAQYLYLLENELLDIEIESAYGGDDCVKIMTIHSAKGLEFPVVFLYQAGAAFSSAEKRKSLIVDKTCGMCVYSTDPDEFTKHLSIARLGAVILADRVQVAEEMRLLYVAMTRAMDKLIIVGSGAAYSGNGRTLDDFEILTARNYLDFIRPQDAISADDIKIIEPKREQQFLATPPDAELVKKLRERFEKAYPFPVVTQTAQKASVTSLTKREEDFIDEKPRPMGFTKDRGAEYGTKFHKAMQRIDFSGGVTPPDPRGDKVIEKCVQTVVELTRGMTVHKELMFLQTVTQNGEQILVQGVIDLVAVGNGRVVVIDYKTTNASVESLIEMYKPQLNMYANAVIQALNPTKQGINPNAIEQYIYSTRHQKLIKT